VILCAQMFESVRLLFNSRTPDVPAGLTNSSGRLGRHLMVTTRSSGCGREIDSKSGSGGFRTLHYLAGKCVIGVS
jgi:hypothetical protein